MTRQDKKYKIKTFGCQMNSRDSETLAGYLKNLGYSEAENDEEISLLVYNTCAVRQKAEEKVMSRIGALKPLKEKNPSLIIAICGCMVQKRDIADKIRRRHQHISLLFGTHNIDQFPELLEKAKESRSTVVEIKDEKTDVNIKMPVYRKDTIKASVNINYGCNNYCSYCIVPYVRGREKSRLSLEIIKEIEILALDGYKEILLLGQNVNSYGGDLAESINFADLLKKIDGIDGIRRVRYMTSHPKDFTEELVLAVKECEKVCEHFHLPVQAGSNNILEKMNRKYTREHYFHLTEMLRKHIPNASISTDFIVGFPGETEEDFLQTIDLVEKVKFDDAYTFIYSPREGTPAAEMTEQISKEVKKTRIHKLIEIQTKINKEKNNQLLNKEVKILVEGPSKLDKKKMTGRTKTNRIVNFQSETDLTGAIIPVIITEAKSWSLEGKMV